MFPIRNNSIKIISQVAFLAAFRNTYTSYLYIKKISQDQD